MFSTLKFYIKYSIKQTNSCYLLFILYNFKLKTEGIVNWKIIAGDLVKQI